MEAVLYVGHGSRVRAACRQLTAFIETCEAHVDAPIQEICFLELAAPDIAEGVRRCVERGADRIAVVPVLLFAAGHAKRDIPRQLEEASRAHPRVTFRCGRPFGVDERLVDVLMERVRERADPLAGDAAVLLVGRGSSDPEAKSGLEQTARLLREKHPFRRMEIAYLAAAEPAFLKGLQWARQSTSSQVFIVPYLLFPGVLKETMRSQVACASSPQSSLMLCEGLGAHPNVRRALVERVKELIRPYGPYGLYGPHGSGGRRGADDRTDTGDAS